MKKLFVALCLFLGFWNTQAQDPILFEFDWYLSVVRVDGTISTAPSNSEVEFVDLFLGELASPHDMLTNVCNVLVADAEYPEPGQVIFTNMAQTLIDCSIGSNSAFEGVYFDFFFSAFGEVLDYSVGIIDAPSDSASDGDLYWLAFFKDDGDFAEYFSKPLSTEEFQLSELFVYPNPAIEVLNVFNPREESLLANIYASDGRLLGSQTLLIDQLNISDLSSGVYFLELIGEQGRTVKRFVKK